MGNEERVLGSREMLWNIQRQIKASIIHGKEINLKQITNILTYICEQQQIQENVNNIYNYKELSLTDLDIISNSKYMLKELQDKSVVNEEVNQ